jgi:aldehyde dehydrogenase (NAD+)
MSDFKEMLERQRMFFESGVTRDIDSRKEQLMVLEKAVIANESDIMAALKKNLNKSSFETYMTEIGMVLDEIKYTRKHLSGWVRPKRVKTPFTQFLSSSRIYSEPYGVVLIMSPWNYPFQLALAPLIGAMAGGELLNGQAIGLFLPYIGCHSMNPISRWSGVGGKRIAICWMKSLTIFSSRGAYRWGR